jgi:hypothetical protein
MKALACTLALFALLVAGCSPKPDPRDARIAKLEKEVERLYSVIEQNDAEMMTLLTNQFTKIGEKTAAVISDQTSTVLRVFDAELEDIRLQLTNTAALASAAFSRQAAPVTRQQVGGALREGIPLSVYNRIASDAARDWPNDFRMQSHEIDKQVAAYKTLAARLRR